MAFDKYGVVDLKDVCGHLLVMVLVSVHTTSDSSTYLNYYLAAFPECIDALYQEQLQVLDQICKECEEQRQGKILSGEIERVEDFAGTELDPTNDRDLSVLAIKRMVTYKEEHIKRRSSTLRLHKGSNRQRWYDLSI